MTDIVLVTNALQTPVRGILRAQGKGGPRGTIPALSITSRACYLCTSATQGRRGMSPFGGLSLYSAPHTCSEWAL